MKEYTIAELVMDFDIYPRSKVDTFHCNAMKQAIQSGAEFPPVVICKKTKRIVDGFHRCTAFKAIYGPSHKVQCVEKTYKSDANLFVDVMRFNASHGKSLSPCDKARCAIIAERLHVPDDAVAGALHVSAEYLGELRVDKTATAGGLHVPLKRTIQKQLAGRKLTDRQALANTRLSGMNQQFYVNQVIELIESNLLDMEDDNLMEKIERLRTLLEGLAKNV